MKKMVKKCIAWCILTTCTIIHASNNVTPYYSIRSQSSNTALRYAGLARKIHLFDKKKIYGTFTLTPSYYQSFRPKAINKCLFGNALLNNDCCDTINISGSRAFTTGTGEEETISGRPAHHLLADYFYLPTDFKSEVKFSPKVKGGLLDIDLYAGLDEWQEGWYIRLHAPFVWTRLNLNMCERVINPGTQAHVEGYFGPTEVNRTVLLENFTSYAQGKTTDFTGVRALEAAGGAPSSYVFSGLQFERLTCSKMCPCSQTKTGLADLRVYMGLNFINKKNGHLGINIQVAAPTGSRPEGEFLFEPVIGNGGHFAIGAGLNGHGIFWSDEKKERSLGFYFDANFTHLVTGRQKRCLDLKCKELSRYMLAAKHTSSVKNLLNGGDTASVEEPATAQFDFAYAPVANLTHMTVDVSIPIQIDLSAFFNYTSGSFSWDLGYNFWYRSCENIKPNCKQPSRLTKEPNTWTLKGDAHVVGFGPVNLAVSQCPATVFTGTNYVNDATIKNANRNPGIDNPELAFTQLRNPGEAQFNFPLDSDRQIREQTRTSLQVIFLSDCDIDFEGAQTRGLSHKIFTHISYAWTEEENVVPYVGVGASAEFGTSSNYCTDDCPTTDCCECPQTTACGETCCPKCNTCGLSQWSVWFKGGISF